MCMQLASLWLPATNTPASSLKKYDPNHADRIDDPRSPPLISFRRLMHPYSYAQVNCSEITPGDICKMPLFDQKSIFQLKFLNQYHESLELVPQRWVLACVCI